MRLLLAMLLGLFAASTPALAQGDAGLIARGAYLARAADCGACHRAPDAGGVPYAGGYVIASPMGDIIAPNITPSRTAGIGNWSFADFDRAMRKGERPDGAKLYPAMPYTDYQGISDGDMRALYAFFLQGVKPADTVPAKTALPFPFNVRMIMTPWNWMFRSDKPFKPTAGLTPQAQRGQYLVETLGHCGSCHTPRNMLMAETQSKALSGGSIGGWHAPNITSDPISGIGGWRDAEIVDYLSTGHVAGKGVAAGGMGEAVEHSLRYLSRGDLFAIAAYLKASKPVRDSRESKPSYAWSASRPVAISAYEVGDRQDQAALIDHGSTNGATLYGDACGTCHGLQGEGTKDHFYPALVGSSTTGSADPSNLVMTILGGVSRDGADGKVSMPAFAAQMTDDQIAAVANHVLTHFGRPGTNVTAKMVAVARNGGPRPLLLKLMPWLMVAACLILALLAYAIGRRWRGMRRNER